MKPDPSTKSQPEQHDGPPDLKSLLDVPPGLLELLPVAAYACDAAGRVLWFNRRAADLWGRLARIGDDAELFCGSHKLNFGGRWISPAETPMAAAMRSGEPIHGMEGLMERPDGSTIWVTVHIDPVKDAAGHVLGAINCFIDTTELHLAKEAAAQEQARTRGMLDALPMAVYTTDAAGRITYYNEAAVKLAGREPRLGSDQWCLTWKLYRPDGTPLPHGECPMALALKEKRPNSGMEAVAERPDGTRVPFIPYPTPLFDEAGNLTGAVNMLIDITERKAFEQTLRQNEIELRASEAQLSEELDATRELQALSTEMVNERGAEAIYEKIIEAAVSIMRSDFASMQILHPKRGEGGELRLMAFQGFSPEAAKFWEWVRVDSDSACGAAMRAGKRVVTADVGKCDFMVGSKDLEVYLQTGIRAVQTTPLVSRSGHLLGMVSTHWRTPHDPSDSELRRFDVLARQTADFVERIQADEELQRSHAELRRYASELERFNSAAVGRETRMIELKKENNQLRRQLGEKPLYPLEFEKAAPA